LTREPTGIVFRVISGLRFIILKEITMNETMERQKTAPSNSEAKAHAEDGMTRALEYQSARVPSDIWLFAALGSMAAALALRMNDKKDQSLFVGQWAAPFLLIGVYNKLIKINGSDRPTN